jgi:hypothetical protein
MHSLEQVVYMSELLSFVFCKDCLEKSCMIPDVSYSIHIVCKTPALSLSLSLSLSPPP